MESQTSQTTSQTASQIAIKRKRARNFTQEEVRVLIEGIEKYSELINAPFKSTIHNEDKTKAWEVIAKAVNSVNKGALRTGENCRKKWHEFSSQSKKKEAARRRETLHTGGGKLKTTELTPLEEKAVALMPHVQIDGIPGAMDTSNLSTHPSLLSCKVPKAPKLSIPDSEINNEDNVDNASYDGEEDLFLSQSEADVEEPGSSESTSAESQLIKKEKSLSDLAKKKKLTPKAHELTLIEIEESRLVIEKERLEIEKQRLELSSKQFNFFKDKLNELIEIEKCKIELDTKKWKSYEMRTQQANQLLQPHIIESSGSEYAEMCPAVPLDYNFNATSQELELSFSKI